MQFSARPNRLELCCLDACCRRLLHALSLAVLFVCLFSIAPARCADLNAQGYVFKVIDADWGPEEVYICPNGIKKVLTRMKFNIVARAPKWQPIAYRDENKTICPLRPFENPLRQVPVNAKVTRVKTVLKGLPVIRETFNFTPVVWDETESMIGQFMPSGNASKASMTVVGSETLRFVAPVFSKELLQAAARVLQVPALDGFPVENRWILKDGGRFVSWYLVDWKRVHLKESDFLPPKNYKLCKSFRDFEAKSASAQMEDLAKQMDFGEPLGGSTKR